MNDDKVLGFLKRIAKGLLSGLLGFVLIGVSLLILWLFYPGVLPILWSRWPDLLLLAILIGVVRLFNVRIWR